MRDPDIWWHLRNAETLLDSHHFIHADAYSFTTAGQPWINPEWLAELPFLLGFRVLGERGLFLVMLAAFELIIAGVLLLCYRRSGDVKAAFLATWAAVLFAVINLGPRTILFGWICFIAMVLLLEEFRRGRDRLWLLAPIFCLWINLHGSWVIGLVFFLLFIASGWVGGEWGCIEAVRWTAGQQRKLWAVAAGCVAALFVNPYGWRLVAYPFDFLFRQQRVVAALEEWQSTDFQGFYGNLFFIVVGGLMVLNLARRRAWPLHELLFALLACYCGVTHRRLLFLTGMVICPLLAVELAGVVFEPNDPKRNKPLLSAAIMAGFLYFAIHHVPPSAVLRAAETQYFPVGAQPTLESACAGQRVFNRYEWGGYLIWNARTTPVFFDSRTDIFDHQGVLADGLNALKMHDSLEILDQYRIGCVLLDPGEELVYQLRRTPGWRVSYEDGTAVLLKRVPESLQPSTETSVVVH